MPSSEASRHNASKSTGPRTQEGKAASRLNALSHGAFAADLLLPGEDREAFCGLEAGFRDHHCPANSDEEFLVSRIVLAAWRLQRLAAMESRVLRAHLARDADVAHLWDSRGIYLGPSRAHPARQKKDSAPEDPIADAWLRDAEHGNALAKLYRYQTALERSFYRALRALQRLRSPASAPDGP